MTTPELIKHVVETLVATARPAQVILFGSHARGDATSTSDIDLLVIESGTPDTFAESVRLNRAVRQFHVPIDNVVVSESAVQKWAACKGAVIKEAITEGVVLHDASH